MKKKTGLFLSLACCLVILWLLQLLLTPKYMGQSRDGSLIGEYYDNAGGNDVLFIGDCEVYENFSPITLWENYGITSYIRGSPQQMIWQSYYLLEEMLRYETPRVVVFNVLAMKYDTPQSTGSQVQREAYNRMTLDGMRWSSSKWKAVQASMTQQERQWDGAMSYLFPILRYHSRWSELTAEDFRYLFQKPEISHNGYLMNVGIDPVTDPHVEKPIADYTFGENSYYYLDKITALCKEKNIQLVLIKAPSLYPVWWDPWEEQMEQYALENDLLYINFLELQQEVGIDWNTDTYDTGLHLNVYGAEKMSDYFGKILSEQCGVPDRRGEASVSALWAEKASRYYEEKQALESARES